ncbi:MAG: hypothetical protein EBV06_00985 [Planctomycetia bacterium]|nr:hypothetical protein [Planctomycetia bacterium]
MPVRFPRSMFTTLLGLLLAGCGVAEYEARLKETQQRVKRYDEEAKLLGPLVNLPVSKNESGQDTTPIQFALRLPVALSTQPSKDPRGGLFYDYLPAQVQASGAFPWAAVAFSKKDDAGFPENLMKWFQADGNVKRQSYVTRHKVAFERTSFDHKEHSYWIHLHKGNQQQIAIVYAVPKVQANQNARAIDLSLDSFGFESALEAARKAYQPKGPLDREVPR